MRKLSVSFIRKAPPTINPARLLKFCADAFDLWNSKTGSLSKWLFTSWTSSESGQQQKCQFGFIT